MVLKCPIWYTSGPYYGVVPDGILRPAALARRMLWMFCPSGAIQEPLSNLRATAALITATNRALRETGSSRMEGARSESLGFCQAPEGFRSSLRLEGFNVRKG